MAFLIYSTWPDEQTAKQAANNLLKRRLIACANISSNICSIYRWQGEVCTDEEVQMWMKTGGSNIDKLRNAFLELHPSQIPAFVALPIELAKSHKPFINWLETETGSNEHG